MQSVNSGLVVTTDYTDFADYLEDDGTQPVPSDSISRTERQVGRLSERCGEKAIGANREFWASRNHRLHRFRRLLGRICEAGSAGQQHTRKPETSMGRFGLLRGETNHCNR